MDVVVKRSSRRKKTIQARVVGGVMEVQAPAHLSDSELQDHISRLKARIERKMDSARSDSHLEERARFLNARYFGGALEWTEITYSSRQARRRGSCTPLDRTIRISDRMKEMPGWVEDHVIMHELAHLLEPNHGKKFKALINRYPLAERAAGYLMAVDDGKR